MSILYALRTSPERAKRGEASGRRQSHRKSVLCNSSAHMNGILNHFDSLLGASDVPTGRTDTADWTRLVCACSLVNACPQYKSSTALVCLIARRNLSTMSSITPLILGPTRCWMSIGLQEMIVRLCLPSTSEHPQCNINSRGSTLTRFRVIECSMQIKSFPTSVPS